MDQQQVPAELQAKVRDTYRAFMAKTGDAVAAANTK